MKIQKTDRGIFLINATTRGSHAVRFLALITPDPGRTLNSGFPRSFCGRPRPGRRGLRCGRGKPKLVPQPTLWNPNSSPPENPHTPDHWPGNSSHALPHTQNHRFSSVPSESQPDARPPGPISHAPSRITRNVFGLLVSIRSSFDTESDSHSSPHRFSRSPL